MKSLENEVRSVNLLQNEVTPTHCYTFSPENEWYHWFSQAIKPTVLIGTSGVGKTFTQEVVEAMASFNEVWHILHNAIFLGPSFYMFDSMMEIIVKLQFTNFRNLLFLLCQIRPRNQNVLPRKHTLGVRWEVFFMSILGIKNRHLKIIFGP